jgi:polyhydroxybutyrate depolymerase
MRALLGFSVFLLACASARPAAQELPPVALASDPPPAHGSAGCGVANTGQGSFIKHDVQVGERARSYHLRVPGSYRSSRAYPLIFRWHGTSGEGVSGGLDIQAVAPEDAIVVGADGLDRRWRPATRDEDLALFDLLFADITHAYCVDLSRVFSYGFSAGGWFTNELACARSEIIHASAAIASGPAVSDCTSPVAAWFLHDRNDDVVPFALGEQAKNQRLAANGCKDHDAPDADGCVRYSCEKAPVVACETQGRGHDIRGDFAPPRVWAFFQSL